MIASNSGPGWERIPAYAVRTLASATLSNFAAPTYIRKRPGSPHGRSKHSEYFRHGLNSGTPAALGELMEMIALGQVFGPDQRLEGNTRKNEILQEIFGAGDRGSIGAGFPQIANGVITDQKGGSKSRIESEVGIVYERALNRDRGDPLAVICVFTQGSDESGVNVAEDYIRAATEEAWGELNPLPADPSIIITSSGTDYDMTASPPSVDPLVWTRTGFAGGVRLRLDVVDADISRIRPRLTINSAQADLGIWNTWFLLSTLSSGRYRFRLSAANDPEAVTGFSEPFELTSPGPVANLAFQSPVAAEFFPFGSRARIRWSHEVLPGV